MLVEVTASEQGLDIDLTGSGGRSSSTQIDAALGVSISPTRAIYPLDQADRTGSVRRMALRCEFLQRARNSGAQVEFRGATLTNGG